MNDESPDELVKPLLSGEERKAADSKLHEQLAGWFRRVSGEERYEPSPGESTRDVELREIYRLSSRLAPGGEKRWSETHWEQLLDACYDSETALLEREGSSPKGARKLVQRQWARWDPVLGRFAMDDSDHGNAVSVVVIQREGGFRIHDEILNNLWAHPSMAEDLATAEGQHPRAAFNAKLQWVESIERNHDLDDWEHIPLIAGQDGPDRWAAVCVMAAMDMQLALVKPGTSGGGDFLEDEDDFRKGENLAWLSEAKGGARLWKLLNAAFELGQTLHQYTTFPNPNIENAVRRMHTAYPGKEASPAGKAVEQIIKCFIKDNTQGTPTPKPLLKWLGGKHPRGGNSAPLIVDHRLWVSVLREVSWDKFKNLVRSANRRADASSSPPTEPDR